MASVWPPQPGRDQDEPVAVHVAPQAPAAMVYPQAGQPQQVQPWGLPPGNFPIQEETKYAGTGYHADAPPPSFNKWGNAAPGSRRSFKNFEEEQPKYQDVWAAVLFVLHLGVIAWLAFGRGITVLMADARNNSNASNLRINIQDNSIVLLSVGGALCTLVAVIISFIAVRVMMHHARSIIHIMLMGSVALQGVAAVAAFFAGQMWLFILSVIFAGISLCYYYMVRNRIPFAATNLAVACAALKRSSGPMAAAFGLTLIQMVWQFVWILAMVGAVVPSGGYGIKYGDQVFASTECHTYQLQDRTFQCVCNHESEGKVVVSHDRCKADQVPAGVVFAMLLSFFWTSLVIQNLLHCTVAGVVAEWFLNGAQTASSSWASFKRAATTSFGSVCFGSLLVAIVRTMHQMLVEMRKSQNSTAAACAECLLGLLQRAIEYFNRYAFVEVALYGKSFIESGKAAMALFRSKGLTAIINDQLISTVFTLGCLTTSLVVALFAYLFGVGFGINRDYLMLLVGLGFIVGLVVSSTVMNVVDSAVATVFVCWAEAGEALERTSRELFLEMSSAWAQFQTPNSRV